MARPPAFALLFALAAPLLIGGGSSLAQDNATADEGSGSVRILPSFALGDRGVPAARGELGELTKEAPEDPSHPLPRVTVDVVSAKGGIKAGAIQAAARRGFWAKAIKCYRDSAFLEQSLRIDQTFGVEIAGGKAKVTRSKVKSARKNKKGSKKRETAAAPPSEPKATVEACILESFASLPLPKGKRTSAVVNVRIMAGDEPIAPPDSARERGSGTLDSAELDKAVALLRPSFESCYRSSLEYAPKLWGNLAVRLKIEPDGRVSEAFEHGGPFPEGRVSRCVLASFRAAKLPPAQGGAVRMIVPFALEN